LLQGKRSRQRDQETRAGEAGHADDVPHSNKRDVTRQTATAADGFLDTSAIAALGTGMGSPNANDSVDSAPGGPQFDHSGFSLSDDQQLRLKSVRRMNPLFSQNKDA